MEKRGYIHPDYTPDLDEKDINEQKTLEDLEQSFVKKAAEKIEKAREE